MEKFVVTVGLYSNCCNDGYDMTIGAFDDYEQAKTELEGLLKGDFERKIVEWGAGEDDDICYVDISRLPNGFGEVRPISAYCRNESGKWELTREEISA